MKEFLEFRNDIFGRSQKCIDEFKIDREKEIVAGGSVVAICKKIDEDLQEHSDEFQKIYETTWQNLMEDEVQLHESVGVRGRNNFSL